MIPVDFGDWPGRIIFGVGAARRLAEIVGRVGGSRAMVICGSTVARSDLLSKVRFGLGDKLAVVFAEATAHTPIEMVQRGLGIYRDSGADVLVTVGGGSAIDAGKAIAVMLATGGDLTRYAIRYAPGGEMERHPLPTRTVPHIAVPTTAGSASDVMPTAACRDPESRRKLLFWDDALTPSATVLDPEMTVHTPSVLTAATGMTAMARAVEIRFIRVDGSRSRLGSPCMRCGCCVTGCRGQWKRHAISRRVPRVRWPRPCLAWLRSTPWFLWYMPSVILSVVDMRRSMEFPMRSCSRPLCVSCYPLSVPNKRFC